MIGLIGGLGNQLFQIAFGRTVEHHSGVPVRYDLSSYRRNPDYLTAPTLIPIGRRAAFTRALPFPDVNPGPNSPMRVVAAALRIAAGPRRLIVDHPGVSPLSAAKLGPAWFYGYWQNPNLHGLADVVATIRESIEYRQPSETIAVHVRRGDMLTSGITLGVRQIRLAVDRARAEAEVRCGEPIRIFTDDPEWCARNLDLAAPLVIRVGRPERDLVEFSQHRALVLSPSTFSWWAAALADRSSRIIATEPFVRSRQGTSLLMPNWTVVSSADNA